MDLVERCLRATAGSAESEAARTWRVALAAAEADDGDAAAKALATLAEKPRFAATVILGLAFPAVIGQTATAFDRDVAPGTKALDWQSTCDYTSVERWIVAGRAISRFVVGRLLARAYYGSGGRAALAVVRDHISRGEFDKARGVQESIPEMAKDAAGAARAAIGIAMHDESLLFDAIMQADRGPMIESGGEETESLAGVLAEFATLPADHPVVKTCVDRLAKWGSKYVEKDARSYGVANAVEVCVRAGWLDHARTLVAVVWGDQLRARCDGAIASGQPEPRETYTDDEPSLDEIRNETMVDYRLHEATKRARHRLDAGDRDAAFAALVLGIDAGSDVAPTTPLERVAWARALAAGGQRDAAVDVLIAMMPIGPSGFPREGFQLAVTLLGTDARRFVETALDNKLELARFSDTFRDVPDGATYLARLAARVDDRALELRLITAVANDPTANPGDDIPERRLRAATETLRELAGAYPELASNSPTSERLDSWATALGHDRVLLGGAAAALAAFPVHEILERVGVLQPAHVAELAVELAKQGRMTEALGLLPAHAPELQQKALVRIARACTTPKDRKKVVATFKKCPKSGRTNDAQGVWKMNFGLVHLANDDFDAAIELVGAMKDCRRSGHGIGDLAYAIALRLDEDPARWTVQRTTDLLEALAGNDLHPQDIGMPMFVIVPSAVVHQPALATKILPRIHAKFRVPGDRALLDAVEAVGHARAKSEQAADLFETALGGFSSAIYATAADFVACIGMAPFARRDELWIKALETLRVHDDSSARRQIRNIALHLAPTDAPLVARVVAAAALPHEVLDELRGLIGELVADQLDDAALLPLEAAADARTVLRRVRQAARHLARRGQHAEARRLAAVCGL